MEDELLKVEKDQDKALIKRLLRETLDSRREFIKSLDDGNLRTVTSKYPALKKAIFIQWEFFMLKASITTESLAEKWTEFLHRIDVALGHKEDTDTEEIDHEDTEILIALQKVQQKIRFISKSKKELDLITEMEAKDVNLQSRAKSAPRLVILKNGKSIVNNCFVVGDGLSIEAGPNVKNAIQLLLMCYYVFDLAYPKMYQLLGLLQVYLFGDDAPFIKSSNYIKFEKTFLEQL